MRIQPTAQDIIDLTAAWTGERSADGRPRVSEDVLIALSAITAEQAWHVLDAAGYPHQFAGGWRTTKPGVNLVGRAVTAQFLPHRADFDAAVVTAGAREGHHDGERQNSWVVESLEPGDVMVTDIFGKITEGTVIGDNLGTAIASRTGAGAVIDGGVRDLPGLTAIDNGVFFYRAADPTPIRGVVLSGMNTPIRIGGVTVLPGDIVLGTDTGVTFIPPQYAEEIAVTALDITNRDIFSKQVLAERVYTTAEIDVLVWPEAIEEHYARWLAEGSADNAR
ncbi:RraA family protein [Mycetocola tolaasinivorans]|uniref:Putative 4-hydroxy-4-methyl-2-oxoglutarate aldolase n=1 Tax=Mycetocola tolaasinivorans TaxID=76635 RepID=A0A3L7A4R1_9MICO|nr:RraA family protein [Mycetocola tolaasinivorans]RLP74561.1 RraA family protein [Mycetocola tolaasinivorans]